MNTYSRALLVAAALLVVFLLAAVSLQAWLRREAAALRSESVQRGEAALAAALALAPREPAAWDEAHRAQLAQLLGGPVALHPVGAAPAADPGQVAATSALPGHPDWAATVLLAPLPAGRWQALQQRSLALLVLLALSLAALPIITTFISGRRTTPDTRAPWRQARAEAAGLEQFARLTVERGAALEREHGARVRAEEDLQVSRSLLDRSLEERIRLGRELHDNISQTLYAVTLTLESVRKNMTAAPAIEQRLDQCMAELRRLNQSVRAYIRELEPDAVQATPLSAALADTLAALADPHGVAVEQRLDEDAVRLLPAAHAAEILNLVREAASNAVRHGRARRLTVRAVRGDGAVALAISDDGTGFDPAARGGGHGLANMRARAAALGGTLQIDSTPGKGTRVLLTLPVECSPA